MDATTIISRITSQCPSLKMVEEAFALDDATARSLARPAAYVFLAGEQAETNMARTMYMHKIVQTWRVVIAVNGIRSARSSLVADMGGVRAEIRGALCGWSPGENISKLKFVEGQFVAREANVIWWQDDFSCWAIEQ